MKESFKDYLSHNKQMSFNEILFSFIDEKGFKDFYLLGDNFLAYMYGEHLHIRGG